MDKIEKFLRKLHPRERDILDRILAKLKKGDFSEINVIKLKGHDEIYRESSGRVRIIFRFCDGQFSLLFVGRRSEKTYRNF